MAHAEATGNSTTSARSPAPWPVTAARASLHAGRPQPGARCDFVGRPRAGGLRAGRRCDGRRRGHGCSRCSALAPERRAAPSPGRVRHRHSEATRTRPSVARARRTRAAALGAQQPPQHACAWLSRRRGPGTRTRGRVQRPGAEPRPFSGSASREPPPRAAPRFQSCSARTCSAGRRHRPSRDGARGLAGTALRARGLPGRPASERGRAGAERRCGTRRPAPSHRAFVYNPDRFSCRALVWRTSLCFPDDKMLVQSPCDPGSPGAW